MTFHFFRVAPSRDPGLRKVDFSNVYQGDSHKSRKNRLFVLEPNEENLGREYFLRRHWYCHQCIFAHKMNSPDVEAVVVPSEKIIYVPIKSRHECEPTTYDQWKESQQKLKTKATPKKRTLARISDSRWHREDKRLRLDDSTAK